MSTIVWTVAGLLAALSMMLTIPLTSSTATETITLGPGVLLRAIVAALIGGMRSMPRALVGGVAIGVTEAVLFYNYPSQVGLLDGVLFVAVLVILLVMGGRDRATDHVDGWSFSPRVRPVPLNLRDLWLVRNLPRVGTACALVAAIVFPFIVARPSQQLLFSRVLCTRWSRCRSRCSPVGRASCRSGSSRSWASARSVRPRSCARAWIFPSRCSS